MLTNISLFSGAGGLDLGAKLVGGFRTVAYVEYDRYAQGVLMSRMRSGDLDDAPIFEDVRTFDGRSLAGSIAVVSGGFPCQDVSHAGKRAGLKEGTRSGLWSKFARIIREVGPRFVLVENVPGLLSIDDGGGLELFSGTWPRSGSMRSGSCYPRPMSGLRICERESGLWPTPNASPERPCEGNVRLLRSKVLNGEMAEAMLNGKSVFEAQGKIAAWPTPTSRDGKDKDAANRGGGKASVKPFGLFPTPRVGGLDGGSNSRKAAKKRGRWPTIKANEET